MPHFAYKARAANGELVQGVLEGGDSSAIATQLFNSGVTPVEINPSRSATPDSAGQALKGLFRPRVTAADILLFSRQMYTLLKAGVPIMRALAGLQESTVNERFKPRSVGTPGINTATNKTIATPRKGVATMRQRR